MIRIAGTNLPDNKRLEIGLTYVFGIGKNTAKKILNELKLDLNKRVKDLTDKEADMLRDKIEKNINVEGDLRRMVSQDIKRLKEIGSYRGTRHKLNLPVRGQKTRTNARTKRGKRVTMSSGKKKDVKK